MTTFSHTSGGTGDIIYPYGDFNASSDVTAFWDTSLSSVTTTNVSSASVVSGALKIVGSDTGSDDDSYYTKGIPVVVGESYTIAGTSTVAADTTAIKGGSTSGGNEYFVL